MARGYSLREQQASDTVTSLMSYKNGFELLDAFGYALCSKLGVNWVPLVLAPETVRHYKNYQFEGDTNNLGLEYNELENWANERQFAFSNGLSRDEHNNVLPSQRYAYPKDCAPGKIMIAHLCSYYILDEIEYMILP